MSELTREQRAAVECEAHALEIRAGAGTGKTHTLAHRVAHLAPTARAQSRFLVVTFTREATATLERRLSILLGRDHRVHVGSFHQWAARELPREGLSFMPEAESRRAVQDALRRARPGPAFSRALGVAPDAGEDLALRVLSLVSYAKNAQVSLASALDGRLSSAAAWSEVLLEAEAAYERRKGDRLDFDDLLLRFRDALKSSPRFRAEVRARWDHILVDEYQDVNGIQADTVHLLTTGKDAPRVTVVGDARQAIYGFRGGAPAHLDAFLAPYGRAGKRLALTVNFRATRALVAAANRVAPDAHPMRPRPRAPTGAPVDVVACDDEADEASLIADRVETLLASGVDPADVAVLCRARHLTRALHDELVARLAEERRAEGDAIVRAVDAFAEFAQAARRARPLLGLPAAVEPLARARAAKARTDGAALVRLFGELPWLDVGVRHGARALARRARVSGALPARGMPEAADLLALSRPDGLERLLVTTIHAAKGLEWDHVFLVGAREGGLPIEHALQAPESCQDELLAEERRLVYVAATRARQRLVVTWPRRTMRREHEPCRHLAALEGRALAATAGTPSK